MTEDPSDDLGGRRDSPSIHRLLTRHNGLVFYGLAAASFLESAVPLHATPLVELTRADPALEHWVEESWWPSKYAHGREMQAYIEMTWPEFDWNGAYAEFCAAYRPLVAARRDAACARVLLAYGVAAAQSSVFYRALGTAADDPELRSALYRLSADETVHFESFNRFFTHLKHAKRLGFLAAYKEIVACARRARNLHVRLAYAQLGTSRWYGMVPFPEIEYDEVIRRMAAVVRRHADPGPAQRLLFRPWWQVRPVASALPTAPVARARSFRGRPLPSRAVP